MSLLIPPFCEEDRQRVLEQTGALGEETWKELDILVQAAALRFGVPISAVSLIDGGRQFFKAVRGLDVRETSRDVAFCAHTICGHKPLVVGDARRDKRFSGNALVTGEPRIRFYAGAPIFVFGRPVGSFCVIDREPRLRFSGEERSLIEVFASRAASIIEERSAFRPSPPGPAARLRRAFGRFPALSAREACLAAVAKGG